MQRNEAGASFEYEKALKKNPHLAVALNGLARLKLKSFGSKIREKNIDKAISLLMEAENIEESVESSNLLAQAYAKGQNQFESNRWASESLIRSSKESSFDIGIIPFKLLK